MNKTGGALEGIDYSSPLVLYRGEKITRLVKALIGLPQLPIDTSLAVDTYYTLYLPAPIPRLDSTAPESNRAVIELILGSTIGMRLRVKTVLDGLMSTIASTLLLSRIIEASMSQQDKTTGGKVEYSMGLKALDNNVLADTLRDIENIGKVRALIEGRGIGSTSTELFEEYPLELIRLARDMNIKELLDSITGLVQPGITQSTMEVKSKHGVKLGFELGVDIERVVPRELTLDIDLFMYKYMQKRLLLYSKYIEETTGPIYLLVDKSGSMEGEKILWAKALALALYNRARRENREFYMRYFDSQPHRLVWVNKKLSAKRAIEVFEYIAKMRNGGGTDISRALVTAIQDITRLRVRKSSIILVTDGIDRVIERPIREGLRKTESNLITVMIKGENETLRKLSRDYLTVVKLNYSDILRVVRSID